MASRSDQEGIRPLICSDCGEDGWVVSYDKQTGAWRLTCDRGHGLAPRPELRVLFGGDDR